MPNIPYHHATFDKSDPNSIFEYSKYLVGHSLHNLLGDIAVKNLKQGKGGLGQMVEELFFNYKINSKREADFKEANLELKCTPIVKKNDGNYRIKERLVCTMIDYFETVKTPFEESHLLSKCHLMLLLIYEHLSGLKIYDYEFLFRVLWQLPEKDIILIKADYEKIVSKIKNGEAHLLSEGDTMYLGACRKGSKGDSLQKQPYSEILAKKRAFSLKPSYMQNILNTVIASGQNHYSNYFGNAAENYELVSLEELKHASFDEILLGRYKEFYGLNFIQICNKLGISPYQSKSKYADIASLIATKGESKRISLSDEFKKAGIIIKTVRLQPSGMPKESMSFKNIDYKEIIENDIWHESDLYDLYTRRFMFVVFKPVKGETITLKNNKTQTLITEQSYILSNVFLWTMPQSDLAIAENYWKHIRKNVLANNINLEAFWSIADKNKFHVRPKATSSKDLTSNPHGGYCRKLCYWFNADYVKSIIEAESHE